MTPILTVSGLEKTFGAVVAARSISCAVPAGQTVGIIGANGAGKTTFVNMVSGHLRPTKGQILFGGRDITGMASRDLVPLGISRSFQVAQIFSSLTALENICAAVAISRCGLTLAGLLRNRMAKVDFISESDELLKVFEISEHRDVPAGNLPQGVRKILDIAMAFASAPKMLLLDEPTSGVSREERYHLMERVIGVLKISNTTVLFVEHDMEVVTRFADRILAFYEGGIIADGHPAEVLAQEDVRQLIVGTKVRVAPR